MPKGGKITIDIHNTDNKDIKIRIIDQGNGIPEHILNRIGEPFFTTKENGTGLGMLVSSQIIEEHKGSIQIKSDQKGTCIEVCLPACPKEIVK